MKKSQPIKFCKVRDAENIAHLCNFAPTYISFDLRPTSPHYLGEIDQAQLSTIPLTIRLVGVFEAQSSLYITSMAGKYGLSAIQIEGNVPSTTCELLAAEGLEIIKTLHTTEDIKKYEGVCNKFLVRDAQILEKYSSKTPLIIDSSLWHPGCGHIVDMGEEFESRTAYKDTQKIENWLKNKF